MLSVSSYLNTKIEFLKGVGENRAVLLRSELNIHTFFDLLNHFPFRYVDRTQFHLIKNAKNGDTVQLRGRIIHKEKVKGHNRRYRLSALFQDSSGFIELIWFRSVKWIEESINEKEEYIAYGKISVYKGKKNMAHPELELHLKAGLPGRCNPFIIPQKN